ncbi:MAG: hypothetical protein HDR88_18190 [Bacteroides sp.]|nr:hypothetical protein [Bacteroides sp.]
MRSILKIIGGLLIGITAGLTIAALITIIFTDTTLPEFISKLCSMKAVESMLVVLVGVVAFIVSIVIIVTFHEAGHLVGGLLSGYEFVSFRIFNFTFIKVNGKIKVKRFSITGTGGQCLLAPPDLPVDKIPTSLYLTGGILANITLLIMVFPFFFLKLNPFIVEILTIFCLTDLFLLIINGIPMKLNGMGNDGYDWLNMRHNLLTKRAVMTQLRSNAMIQNGVRPKDMPEEWFEWKTDIDYKNPLEVSIPFMHASRLVDEMDWEQAYIEHEDLYSHNADIMPLYVNEMACELVFLALATHRQERARQLLDDNLKKYIDTYQKTMSSKQRVLCAIDLWLNNDREKALKKYEWLKANQAKYLLQGEVKSDLAIMHKILNKVNKTNTI